MFTLGWQAVFQLPASGESRLNPNQVIDNQNLIWELVDTGIRFHGRTCYIIVPPNIASEMKLKVAS
jgi:hypothetical protein